MDPAGQYSSVLKTQNFAPASRFMRLPEICCPKTTRWNLSSLDALNAVWADCARIFLSENTSGRQPRWGTEIRLGWNHEELQGLFLCQDLIPWATETNPGDALWGEEVVEIFLDPFGDSLSYFEISINTLNTVTDLFIRRTRIGLKKDFNWRGIGDRLWHSTVRMGRRVPDSV